MQAFIISSASAEAHSSAHRWQASAQAPQDVTISELCRPIIAAAKAQKAPQSATIWAIRACWVLPAAANVMQ